MGPPLVVQWVRIRLQMAHRVDPWSGMPHTAGQVGERHNYWACALGPLNHDSCSLGAPQADPTRRESPFPQLRKPVHQPPTSTAKISGSRALKKDDILALVTVWMGSRVHYAETDKYGMISLLRGV